MLRGRGGCYKHTFYGIESHRCMETTPSLACANKCVFCWRSAYVCWVHRREDEVLSSLSLSLSLPPYLPLPPSLSLFLRHHTNPVGTEWRWKMDDPEMILKGALENHYQMIKQFRGMSCMW
ncbi:MAG: hypothetical protein MJE68_23145 [Proteobacteria bacterium]|nr:hypothetical protein [Pseudomonadota bacterium]